MLFQRDHMKKELQLLEKQEQKFLKKNQAVKSSMLQKKLAEVVPEKLQDTLNRAFIKAFELVFEKGSGIIEKTYKKEQHEQGYLVNAYAAELSQNKKNLRAFGKQAKNSKTKNLIVSGVEGVGLGLLGIGLPDIPLFTGVLLKSIYEIALSYGFSYDSQEEQLFILKVIETALLHGEMLDEENEKLNAWCTQLDCGAVDKKEQIKKTAYALSEELLYMKFLQGIPIAGIVGGVADAIYLNRITEYADLKYKRRFYQLRGR